MHCSSAMEMFPLNKCCFVVLGNVRSYKCCVIRIFIIWSSNSQFIFCPIALWIFCMKFMLKNQNNHYSANDVIASTLLVTIRHIFFAQTNKCLLQYDRHFLSLHHQIVRNQGDWINFFQVENQNEVLLVYDSVISASNFPRFKAVGLGNTSCLNDWSKIYFLLDRNYKDVGM